MLYWIVLNRDCSRYYIFIFQLIRQGAFPKGLLDGDYRVMRSTASPIVTKMVKRTNALLSKLSMISRQIFSWGQYNGRLLLLVY